MKIAALIDTLTALWSEEHAPSVLLEGPPGVGKNAAIREAAQRTHRDLHVVNLTTCDEVDLRGMPYRDGDRSRWASPFPREGRGIVVLDELSSAPRAVQTAAHHLLYREGGSDVCVGPGWAVIATGNQLGQQAHIVPLTAPARNRLLHLVCESDLPAWVEYAEAKHYPPALIGWLKYRPELLCAETIPPAGPFCSPRSWEAVAQLLQRGALPQREALLAGCVGEGPALELCAHLHSVGSLPSVEEIAAHPTTARLPEGPAQTYALVALLAHHAIATQQPLMAYVSRLDADWVALFILKIRDHVDLKQHKSIVKWLGKHPKTFQQ